MDAIIVNERALALWIAFSFVQFLLIWASLWSLVANRITYNKERIDAFKHFGIDI